MQKSRYLLGALLLLGACSDTPVAAETPQTSQPPSGATCPTNDTLIPVAIATPVAPGQITAISEIHCSMPWAVAQVDVRDGATDEEGNPVANAYVQIFRLDSGGWNVVDRDDACSSGQIPTDLKQWSCDVS
jgi:hypothetical protein